MSLPTQNNNLVGSQLLNLTDLALPTSLASASSKDSVAVSTGIPASVFVLGVLASGQGTIKLKVGATSTIDMTSGTTDFAVPANGRTFANINTAASTLFFKVRLTDANWSSAYSSLGVFVLYGLEPGEGWKNVFAGYMACANDKLGDGSGVVDLAVGQ